MRFNGMQVTNILMLQDIRLHKKYLADPLLSGAAICYYLTCTLNLAHVLKSEIIRKNLIKSYQKTHLKVIRITPREKVKIKV